MNNFQQFILEFWNENWADIILFGFSIFILVWKLIGSKIKNEKLKRLFSILPECMEIAEEAGGTSEQKLSLCILEIKNRVKGFKDDYLKSLIESAIKISKTCNVQSEHKATSRTTRN